MASGVVVLDNGAGSIKLGFAGEESPRLVFPNCTAKAKGERTVMVGDMLLECKDIMSLNVRRPFDRGYLSNWDLEQDIWWRALRTSLKVSPGDYGLALTEPMFNFQAVTAATQEAVFEEFGFASLFTAPAPWFSMQRACVEAAAGSSSSTGGHGGMLQQAAAAGAGLVLDLGFSFCHAVPFFDGEVLLGGVRRLNVGGKALTNHLKELVSYRSFNMMEEGALMETVKEQLCFVSADVAADLRAARAGARSPHAKEFVLPDGVHNLRGYVREPRLKGAAAAAAARADAVAAGADGAGGSEAQQQRQQQGQGQQGGQQQQQPSGRQGKPVEEQVLLLNNERFMVPEVLFHPSDIGLNQGGLHEVAAQAVAAVHPAVAPLQWGHVVVTGGCANCPGLAERLRSELRPLVPEWCELNVVAPQQPELHAWRGASAFGASREFADAALTKAQYEERGPHYAGATGRR